MCRRGVVRDLYYATNKKNASMSQDLDFSLGSIVSVDPDPRNVDLLYYAEGWLWLAFRRNDTYTLLHGIW
jgi:hypothetical protein